MIQLRVSVTPKYPCEHWPGIDRAAGYGCVDRIIDKPCGIASGLEGAESQIIIPGNHGELSVFLIQIIVVDHGTGVAVEIEDEIVDYEIADHFVCVNGIFDVFRAI